MHASRKTVFMLDFLKVAGLLWTSRVVVGFDVRGSILYKDPICFVCGRVANKSDRGSLRACSKCRGVSYCSSACEKKNSKRHFKECVDSLKK